MIDRQRPSLLNLPKHRPTISLQSLTLRSWLRLLAYVNINVTANVPCDDKISLLVHNISMLSPDKVISDIVLDISIIFKVVATERSGYVLSMFNSYSPTAAFS